VSLIIFITPQQQQQQKQQTTTSHISKNFTNIDPIVTETGSKVASWYTIEYWADVKLAPKPSWFLRNILATISTLKLEQGAATEARTSSI
jgi:hypothetical protein